MRLLPIFGVVAGAAVAAAFKDTSPYLLFSTSGLPQSLEASTNVQIQPASTVLENAKNFLAKCLSDTYIVVSQASLSAADLSSSTAVPFLRRAISSDSVRTRVSIAEVSGEIDAQDIAKFISSTCNAIIIDITSLGNHLTSRDGQVVLSHGEPQVDEKLQPKDVLFVKFGPLPSSQPERSLQLADNDAYLKSILDAQSGSYTVVYTSTPVSESEIQASYEADFTVPSHMGMKRQSRDIFHVAQNSTVRAGAPLFEKYQFFTPSLFMGLFVVLLLLSILGVGINALASLKVSYGAFDKEMGPAAQKKQQ